MKKNTTSLLYSLLLLALPIFGQKEMIKKADKAYSRYAYVNALKIYEELVNKGYKSKELYKKLGNAYYYNADYVGASKWYAELFKLKKTTITPEYYFRYALSLKSEHRYQKSDSIMKKFITLTKDDTRAALFEEKATEYLQKIFADSGKYSIQNLTINSDKSDFAPSFFNNQIIFSSARTTKKSKKYKNHNWNEEPFLDLFVATISNNSSPKLKQFSDKINTRYHESTTAFTNDGNTMYFTRNNYYQGRFKKDNQGVNRLKLFKASRKDGKWKKIKELPFNNDSYSTAHPSLSQDGKQLYFCSDMPGSIGQSDLYVVDINEDGTYGKPRNLGRGINTEGRETFPFISKDNKLFFASDGHLGLGGLDVFVIDLESEDKKIQNLGPPINSSDDDFSLVINTDTNNGYFSSNRSGGKGGDDIYSFTGIICKQKIHGKLLDKDNQTPINKVKLTLYNENNVEVAETFSDSQGNYEFEKLIECDKIYFVRARKTLYQTNEIFIYKQASPRLKEYNLFLEKEQKQLKVGDDLTKILDITIIYFDLDEYHIRPEAEIELEKMFYVMKYQPEIKIEVRSHTDSRANDNYNLILSEKRSKSIIQYFISKGIAPNRLSGKGYGETKLINRCKNGVPCTEKEHQKNRRSEFIVVR